MRHPCVLLALLAVLAGFSPAFAETYAEFSDGRYMSIRGHEIGDGWIRLEVAPASWMVVPTTSVSRIDGKRGALWVRSEPTNRFLREVRAADRSARAVARRARLATSPDPSPGSGHRTDSRVPPIR